MEMHPNASIAFEGATNNLINNNEKNHCACLTWTA